MKQNKVIAATVMAAMMGISATAMAQTAPENQPGTPSSLRETYSDWQVTCVQRDDGQHCMMSQQQADAKTKQRILGIELRVAKGVAGKGSLVLPFGLALDAGVAMQVDNGVPGPKQPFITCLPVGCIVPFAVDEALTIALRRGVKLNVMTAAYQNRQPVTFTVSLKGFSAALDRIQALAK